MGIASPDRQNLPVKAGKAFRSKAAEFAALTIEEYAFKNTHIKNTQFQKCIFLKKEYRNANAVKPASQGKILPPMELLMDVPQALVRDVGVDLGGRHVLVAQKLLDAAQIGAA
jgi:hypothetical protein